MTAIPRTEEEEAQQLIAALAASLEDLSVSEAAAPPVTSRHAAEERQPEVEPPTFEEACRPPAVERVIARGRVLAGDRASEGAGNGSRHLPSFDRGLSGFELEISEERITRATAAGSIAQEKYLGHRYRVSRTSDWPGPGYELKRVFVLLRGAATPTAWRCSGVFFGRFAEFAGYVVDENHNIASDAIFHGWQSHQEAWAYWRAARGETPWTMLLARPLEVVRR